MICLRNNCMMQSKKPLQSCRTMKPLLSGGGITNGRPGPKLKRIPVLNRFHKEVITYHSYTGGSVEECLIEYLDAKGAYLYGVR